MKKGISTVLLAYKEADNLRILIPQIKNQLDSLEEEYEIIVVDSMVPLDDTRTVVEENRCRYINQELPGFGGAFKTGIKYADMDKFLILDSDGSHSPVYIPSIYNKFTVEKLDVVIGSRYIKGGHTDDAPLSIAMSHVLNFVFRIFLGINARDLSTDYRMYHTQDLKEADLTGNNYDILQEVLMKLNVKKKDFLIGEIPITFSKRLFGESKRRLLPFIVDYIKSLVRLTALRIHSWRINMSEKSMEDLT